VDFVVLIAGGLVFGLIVGRWWAVAAPIAFAIWNYRTGSPDVFGAADISRGGAATVAGVWASAAVLVGVGVRRFGRAFRRQTH
jgi:hypothetical protein